MGVKMKNERIEFGQLERVDLRDIWRNEDTGFTPWLAQDDNLRFLSKTIGLDLEMDVTEGYEVPFQVDILCKDTASDQWVIIENQMEPTDHAQLGQLITYAARLKGVTIVWIAEAFSEEHRTTLNWLNQISDNNLNIFGLEVELWRIGDSAIAPKFNVICSPHDWIDTVPTGTKMEPPRQSASDTSSELKQLQGKFWNGMNDYVHAQDTMIKLSDPLPQSWIHAPIGRDGFHLAAVASFENSGVENDGGHELRVELGIDHEDAENYFSLLEEKRSEIEAKLGEELNWFKDPEKNLWRIYIGKPTNLFDEDFWPDEYTWLLGKLELSHRTFARRVKLLRLPEGGE